MIKQIACALLISAYASAVLAEDKSSGLPGRTVVEAQSVSATVESIDYENRNVTLKDEDGKTMSLKVGPVAHNFDQIKPGDKVTFEYMEAIALDVKRSDEGPGAEAELTVERAPKGSLPKGMISGTITVRASVESIDYKSRYVTLKGPEGKTLTMKVGDQAKRFHEVKKGDQVVVQYTEALAISVTPRG